MGGKLESIKASVCEVGVPLALEEIGKEVCSVAYLRRAAELQ